jgi:perosamine synthetase
LSIALLALGLKQGDEVIIPNLTMIASPFACSLIGIKPILVDINNDDLCMDFDGMTRSITSNTKAIMYVSLNGRGKNIRRFVEYCKTKNLFLLEDAAQSFGSKSEDKFLGTFGNVGSFSFSPHKIITTGQGGALVTSDSLLYEKIERIKDFGRVSGGTDFHPFFGINSKFTDMQAVIGIEQIKKLGRRIIRKKEIFDLYRKYLQHIDEIEFIPTDLEQTVPWFVDIYTSLPGKLQEYLKLNNIGSRRIYQPINKQPAFHEYNVLEFPITNLYSSRGLWLPSSVNLSNDNIRFIANTIEKFYRMEH